MLFDRSKSNFTLCDNELFVGQWLEKRLGKQGRWTVDCEASMGLNAEHDEYVLLAD